MPGLSPKIIERARDEVTAELIRRAREGDKEARDKLIDIWTPPGVSFLRKRCRTDDANDIFQNAWYKICRHKFAIKNEFAFASFYYKTLRNEWIAFYRSGKRYGPLPDDFDPPDGHRSDEHIWQDEVKKFLSGFPEGRILWYAIENSPKEAIQHFGKKLGTDRDQYYYRIRIAKARLRAFLKVKKEGA